MELTTLEKIKELARERDGWRRIAFRRGELLDEVGADIWMPAQERLEARRAAAAAEAHPPHPHR